MIKAALLRLANSCPEIQLYSLAYLHRQLKREKAQLNLAKLAYYEQGLADAWQHDHDELAADLALVEKMLETLCPLPALPVWM